MKDLRVEVLGVKKRCGAKHKPGDHFFVRGAGMVEIPKGKKICLFALNSLFPFLTAKQREDELPADDWVGETDVLACPDPGGVSFKITCL